jgi:hypothetical protein
MMVLPVVERSYYRSRRQVAASGTAGGAGAGTAEASAARWEEWFSLKT